MLLFSCFWKALVPLNIPRLLILPGPCPVHISQSSGKGYHPARLLTDLFLRAQGGPARLRPVFAQSFSLEQELSGRVNETQSRTLKGSWRFMAYFRPQNPIKLDPKACLSKARGLAIRGSSSGTVMDFCLPPYQFLSVLGNPCYWVSTYSLSPLPKSNLSGSRVTE